jgi:phage tail sheath protein FI
MPVLPTYPGIYIQELASGVRTITGVATSITAFIGRALRGLSDRPVRVQSFAEYERAFGGLWARSQMGYAVRQYFLNGGTDALIVRVHNGAAAATLTLKDNVKLAACSEGLWGEKLRVRVTHDTRPPDPAKGETQDSLFNLAVKDSGTGTVEVFPNLSTDPDHRRYVTKVLDLESNLVRIAAPGTIPAKRPDASGDPDPGNDPLDDPKSSTSFDATGDDGYDIGDTQVAGNGLEAAKRGLWALERADLFNLLCIPPFTPDTEVQKATWDAAVKYAGKRRAMLIVDPPAAWDGPDDIIGAAGLDTVVDRSENAAIFFPRIRLADPLRENRLSAFAPCGAIAGIFARTDAQRGVWKAPAGTAATLTGVAELTVSLTDGENGRLNPLGINCLRTFTDVGRVVWGARTLTGADRLASEWKYIPVRRLALFLEESLFRGTQWVVFEPNDEPLWSQIRLNVGAFLHTLFRQGAFQGRTPRDAYFVKCDRETTTQADIDNGVVNILVGFAPLKPAEFVIIQIQQIAGQIET